MILTLLLACAGEKLACGPGTVQDGALCVAEAETGGAGGDDSDSAGDSSDPVDSGDSAEDGPIEVYILAGQSNMDGYGVYTGLPPTWLAGRADVPLFWSGWGEFRALAPTSYGGSPYTGPEVAIGWTLADAGRRVALVKHAVGGTDLYAYWYPGDTAGASDVGAGWSVLLSSMKTAEAELNASGEDWRWAGFIWMQGESDAIYESYADVYADNLARLLRRVREETDSPELPAVLGLIACEGLCTYLDEVRAAQQEVADADEYTTTVETIDLPRNIYDTWHYDGPGTRQLGVRLAQAILGESPQEPVSAALKVSTYATSYDGNYTVGWVFTTDRPITITDVGGFSVPGSYLYTGAELGIWDNDTADLVLRTTVPSWYEAPTTYRDGFWYTAIDPVVLEPGTYAVGLVAWSGDSDRYADSAAVTVGDGISLDSSAYVSSYWLAFPYNQSAASASALSFLGPSFLYRED